MVSKTRIFVGKVVGGMMIEVRARKLNEGRKSYVVNFSSFL